MSIAIASLGRVRARDAASPVNASSAPVRTSPPMIMNIAAIVHGAGLDNTARAAS